jgi:hypothetical protein
MQSGPLLVTLTNAITCARALAAHRISDDKRA